MERLEPNLQVHPPLLYSITCHGRKKTSQTVRQRMNKVLMSILFNGGFYQMVIEDFFLKFVTLLFLKLSNIIRHDQRIIHVHFRLLNYIRLYFCMEVRKAKLLIVIRQIKLNYL